MSNFGGGEMLVVFLLALIVLGPERLPKVARQAGQMMHKFRQMSSGFQEELRTAIVDPITSEFHGSSTATSNAIASTPVVSTPTPSDTAAADAAPSDLAVTPDTVTPEAVTPDLEAPNAVIPDAVIPDAVTPGAAVGNTPAPAATAEPASTGESGAAHPVVPVSDRRLSAVPEPPSAEEHADPTEPEAEAGKPPFDGSRATG